MALFPLLGIVFGFFSISMLNGVFGPIINRKLNGKLTTENRATVLSIIGALSKVAYMGFTILTAYYIDNVGFKGTYLFSSLLFLSFCFPAAVYISRRGN